MSKSLASLSFMVGADIRDYQTKMRQVSNQLKETGEKMKSMGKTLSTAITLPVLAAGAGSIKMASDMQESTNKVQVVFGDAAKEIEAFAKTSLTSFGISQNAALDAASVFGDMATSLGVSEMGAAQMAKTLTGLAGDLASFKNIKIEQAISALQGIFTSESEGLKSLGVVMTQTQLQAFALSRGIQKNITDMTEAEKVGLRFEYVLQATKNAQGDAARTAESAANQTRTLGGNFQQIGAIVGQFLLPAYEALMQRINQTLRAFQELNPATQKMIVVLVGLAAAAGPVLTGLGFLSTKIIPITIAGIKAATIAFAALKAVMATNPFGLLAVSLGAVIGAFALFRKTTDDLTGAQKELLAKAKEVNAELGNQIIRSLGAFDMGRAADGILNFTLNIDKLKKGLATLTQGELEALRTFLETQVQSATRAAANAVSDFDKALQTQRLNDYGAGLAAVTLELQKFKTVTDGITESTGIIGQLNEKLKTLREQRELATTTAQIALLNDEIGRLQERLDRLNKLSTRVEVIPNMTPIAAPGAIKTDLQLNEPPNLGNAENAIPIFSELNNLSAAFRANLETVSQMVGGVLVGAFEQAMTSGQNFFQALGDGLVQLLKKLVAAAAAAFALSAIMAAIFPGMGAGAGGALSGAAGFGKNFMKLFGGFAGIPGMAAGGIVPPGYPNDTYPAFLTTGEKVTPPNALPTGGGDVNVYLRGKLEASAKGLRVAFDRDMQNQHRRRGY